MRHLLVCPAEDSLELAVFDASSDRRIRHGISLQHFPPPEPPIYPYVPAYFQYYRRLRAPLKAMIRKLSPTFCPRSCLLALHDDTPDLEAHALSELMIACGVKETSMEYRAFLLSADESYIAVTGSKRAVSVTLVPADPKREAERMFLPIHEATAENLKEAVRILDPKQTLPVYAHGLKGKLRDFGEPVNTQEIARNFLKIL